MEGNPLRRPYPRVVGKCQLGTRRERRWPSDSSTPAGMNRATNLQHRMEQRKNMHGKDVDQWKMHQTKTEQTRLGPGIRSTLLSKGHGHLQEGDTADSKSSGTLSEHSHRSVYEDMWHVSRVKQRDSMLCPRVVPGDTTNALEAHPRVRHELATAGVRQESIPHREQTDPS